jgi:hypothetical protein
MPSYDYDFDDDQLGIQLLNYVNSWNKYVLLYRRDNGFGYNPISKNDHRKFVGDFLEISDEYFKQTQNSARVFFESGYAVLYINDQRITSELDILALPSNHDGKRLADIAKEIKSEEWSEFAEFLEKLE